LFLGFFAYFISGPATKLIAKFRRLVGREAQEPKSHAKAPASVERQVMSNDSFGEQDAQDQDPPRTTH
jgi:hypothetical protein